MSISETAKEHLSAILKSNRTADVVDFSVGGGLISGALYADLSNIIHLLMLLGGLAIIILRLRWYWINRNSNKLDE